MKYPVILSTLILGISAPVFAVDHFTNFAPSGGTGSVNGINVTLSGPNYDLVDDGVGQDEGWYPNSTANNTSFGSSDFAPSIAVVDSVEFFTGATSGSSSSVYTLNFSSPVSDPFLHIDGLGNTGIDFAQAFTLDSGTSLFASGGTRLEGTASPNLPEGRGSISFSGLYSSISFDIDDSYYASSDTFSVALGYTETIAVPEPSALFLAVLGIGFAGFRRRR